MKQYTYKALSLTFIIAFLISCASEENENVGDLREGLEFSDEAYGEREDGSGAFRTHCIESHESNDDPLVHPSQPDAAHHHIFFGNPTVDAYTTSDSLNETNLTSCDGTSLNRSAYWVPALYGASGERITYIEPLFYYKTGYHLPADSIQPPPEGLRMIAGNAKATAIQSTEVIKFRCASWESDQEWFDQGDPLDHIAHIPDCDVDDLVEMRIVFPQCWDGENLDSTDHQSHMAYPSEAMPPQTGTGSCPDSHPIAIPEISYNFNIYVSEETGSPSEWRFSSDMDASSVAGTTAHADWMNGWDAEIMNMIVENCLHTAFECGVGLLGDGTRLSSIITE